MPPDLSPSAEAKAMLKELDELGARVEKIVQQLKAPRKQQQSAEQAEKIAALRKDVDQAALRASANPSDTNVAAYRRLKRELATLEPQQTDTRAEDEHTEPAPRLLCPIDGVPFDGRGSCPVNRNHREGMDPYAGLKASRERLAPHLGRRIWE